MNWNAVLMAGLLVVSSAVVANNETSASDDDPNSTVSNEPYEEFGLAGGFIEEYNSSHKEDLRNLVAQYQGRLTPFQQTASGQVVFGVDQLRESACKELRDILRERPYMDWVESCHRIERESHSETETETHDEKPQETETETHEDKPSETETSTKDEFDEDDRDEYSADPDKYPEAARCEQMSGEDKYRCFQQYCENPHPDHAEPCEKFREYQEERQEDRNEAQTKFATCRQHATSADDRYECAEKYADHVGEDDRWERESRISEAKMAGKIGARVNIARDAVVAADAETGGGYDVKVQVVTTGAKARGEDVDFRVTVDADLPEGRTIVLDVDPAILSGPTLVVRYFDVFEDGSETEVIIRQATDLADVLDATDDGGQPEFWVVQDANGLQLMASVPHWSVHAITVQGIGEFVSAPSVIAGLIFGVVGSVMAAAVLFKPRKGDEL